MPPLTFSVAEPFACPQLAFVVLTAIIMGVGWVIFVDDVLVQPFVSLTVTV